MNETMSRDARHARVEVFRRADGLWDWRLRSPNGPIIATSGGQGYTQRGDCIEGWERTQRYAAHAILTPEVGE